MYRSRKSAQSGFTLIEILVALALITLLAVGISLSFDGSRSRAQTLVSTMNELASANVRMKNDTGCYASAPTALLIQTDGQAAANNFCGRTLNGTWNGPYVAAFISSGTDVNLDKVADGVTVDFAKPPNVGGGSFGATGKKYTVVATSLPGDIVEKALLECNGVATDKGDFVGTKCMGNAAGGTFSILFDETR